MALLLEADRPLRPSPAAHRLAQQTAPGGHARAAISIVEQRSGKAGPDDLMVLGIIEETSFHFFPIAGESFQHGPCFSPSMMSPRRASLRSCGAKFQEPQLRRQVVNLQHLGLQEAVYQVRF
jgi:hypothetical protein